VKKLQKYGAMDKIVLVGAKGTELRCRLIAVPLPDAVANERRRKAKQDRHHSANHSDEYYELLGYSVYITNVDDNTWTADEAVKAYRSRWYIETLFKGWKSHLNIRFGLPDTHSMTSFRAEYFIYASLLMVSILVMPLYAWLQNNKKESEMPVSILKLSTFISQHFHLFLTNGTSGISIRKLMYYCTYDKRKDRQNMIELICDYHP
jgi:hypothetical protein